MGSMSRPLRVLHLTSASDVGGISRYLYDVSEAMHRLGHRVAIAGERGTWHEVFEAAPWPWIDVPLRGGPLALRQCCRVLDTYLQQNPVDLVHTHYRKATLVARRLAKRHRFPVLYTLHMPGIPMRGLWRLLTDLGDHCHVPSVEARDWLVQKTHCPAELVTVIPHGVDPQRFPRADRAEQAEARAGLGIGPQATVAAFVGRFEDPKNEDWMVDLGVAGRGKLPGFQILICGQGPREKALKRRIAREKVGDICRLVGCGDPRPYYAACDALLVPSQIESFSLVSLEAMCMGRPVLRTRTGGSSLQVVEGVTGRTVPVDRGTFVAESIGFLSDRQTLWRMGEAAAQHVREHLAFDRQFKATLDLYHRLLEDHHSRGAS